MFKLQPEPQPVQPPATTTSATLTATNSVKSAVSTSTSSSAPVQKFPPPASQPIPILSRSKMVPGVNVPIKKPKMSLQPPRSNLEKFQFIGDRHVDLISQYYLQKTSIQLNTFCPLNQPLNRIQADLARLRCVSQYTIVLAGARDFLDNINSNVYNYFTGLFGYVRKHSNRVLAVTLPPIPKLMNDERYTQQIAKMNHFIRSSRSSKVLVCDAYIRFFKSSQLNQVNMELFDAEGVYPNAQGIAVLFQALEDSIAPYTL